VPAAGKLEAGHFESAVVVVAGASVSRES